MASEVSKGVAQVSLDTGIPVIFGVITADTVEQAIERAGTKDGNKGKDAALSAIEMANLISQIFMKNRDTSHFSSILPVSKNGMCPYFL